MSANEEDRDRNRNAMALGPRARRQRVVWLVPFLFWSLPAVLTTRFMMQESGVPFLRAFLAEGSGWMLWAVATPGIFLMVRRRPIEGRHRGFNIVIHVMTGLLLGALTGLLDLTLARALDTPLAEHITTMSEVSSLLSVWAGTGLLIYAATATIGFAFDYHRRLRERELAASRLEAELAEARLNALRMQLHPHFLFNALNSVSMLVRQGEPEVAVRIIARLGELMRHVLDDDGGACVALKSEVDFISRYLEIEQLRFRDRMCVTIDIQDAVRDVPVPALLLQPLVENAVRHGVAVRETPTCIALSAKADGDRVRITLRDEGPGLPAGFDEATISGVGLCNTRARLAHAYGGGAFFSIQSAVGGGTEVRMLLPIEAGGARA